MRIGIFMSVFSVHVNRAPAAGEVQWVEHTPGRYLDARDRQAQVQNEHNLVGMQLGDGRKIMVNQIAGAVARRIVCAVGPGRRLEAGERFGMVKFGRIRIRNRLRRVISKWSNVSTSICARCDFWGLS